MADLKISQLPPLSGSLLQETDPVAVADLSASETKSLTAAQLALGIAPMFPAGSISSTAVDAIPSGSITTTELAAGAVTAEKLADNSSGVVATGSPGDGDFIGQVRRDNADGHSYIWTGSAWSDLGSSIYTLSAGSGLVDVTPVQTGGNVVLNTTLDNTTVAAQFLAGPTNAAGVVGYRVIAPDDLPTAGVNKGAVSVSGDGLRMDGSQLEIDNDITLTTAYSLCTVDAKGLVTAHRPVEAGDLPLATVQTAGAVTVGAGLAVDGTGVISLSNQTTTGTFTKVTVNTYGVVTSGTTLISTDIPSLPAEILTSGSLDTARIADHELERKKLDDYSISFIQEASPGTGDASLFTGCLWFQESTAQLRMWNGNAWTPVGFGRLSADNLRFGGTINASTGSITGVTQAGTTGGLVIGQALPAATDILGGLYVVVDVAGNGIAVTPGVSYDAGDWVLCVSLAEGWVRINTIGGGGGSSYDHLSDLLDVNIANPVEGDILVYGSNALWDNVSTLDGGTY